MSKRNYLNKKDSAFSDGGKQVHARRKIRGYLPLKNVNPEDAVVLSEYSEEYQPYFEKFRKS